MCGIAGIINHHADPAAGEIIAAMNECQIHRGPDGAGTYLDNDVALGHRRLSIIDLEKGGQPISNEDGSVIAVFNGEIYNYRKLREELLGRGHKFRSESDTEVIVHLYEELGGECVQMLEGMFAFAVYSRKSRRVLLGRDRMGQKPLLYFMAGGTLVFASEFPALKCHPAMPSELDANAVSDYLSFQYVPGPGTIYRNVHKLAPGHQLEFRLNDGTTSIRSYWRLDYSLKLTEPFDEAARELRRLVEKSVERRLAADVPVGTFLSGGLDSTIVTAVAAEKTHPGKLNAYTIGFSDATYDERPYATRAAEAINRRIGGGLVQREAVVDAEDFSLVEKMAAHCGEPYADASILPTALLSKFAASEIKVALSGDGADEIFCGYERYLAVRYASRLALLLETLSAPLFKLLASFVPDGGERTSSGRLRRFLRAAAAPADRRYYTLLNRCDASLKSSLFGERLRDAAKRDSAELFESLQWSLTGADRIERLSELDLHTYLPGDILPKVDIASMASSLEVRSPFLDREVLEFAARLPLPYKLHGSRRKHILAEAFRDLVPHEISARPKKGFGVPVASYLRKEWHNLAEQALFEGQLVRSGCFQAPAIRKIWSEHQSGRRDHSYLLWSLLLFSLFLDRNR